MSNFIAEAYYWYRVESAQQCLPPPLPAQVSARLPRQQTPDTEYSEYLVEIREPPHRRRPLQAQGGGRRRTMDTAIPHRYDDDPQRDRRREQERVELETAQVYGRGNLPQKDQAYNHPYAEGSGMIQVFVEKDQGMRSAAVGQNRRAVPDVNPNGHRVSRNRRSTTVEDVDSEDDTEQTLYEEQ